MHQETKLFITIIIFLWDFINNTVHILSFLVTINFAIFITQAFSVVFDKAIDRAEASEELKQRVTNLIDCITYSVYTYTTRGLFEKDKLIFSTQMTFLVSWKNNYFVSLCQSFQ